MTMDEWQAEFRRYQEFPEWQQRKSMTLDEFKFIYAWEYGHRMLGRCVGLVFAVPWMYFTARGMIPKGYQPRMFALLAMGGTQGLVGWWMVKSGLGDDRRGDSKEIRVKPIRLATHLSMASRHVWSIALERMGCVWAPQQACCGGCGTARKRCHSTSVSSQSWRYWYLRVLRQSQ